MFPIRLGSVPLGFLLATAADVAVAVDADVGVIIIPPVKGPKFKSSRPFEDDVGAAAGLTFEFGNMKLLLFGIL